MTDLRNKMRDRIIQYKMDTLKVSEQGTHRGHRYPHLLPRNSWVLNILCVNLFFPLREHPEILRLWLSSDLADVREITDLDFEYIGPDDPQEPSGYRNYLNELGNRGQNRTSADVAITWRDNKRSTNLLLLEFKFTEPNFGECSKQGNPDQKRCLSSREIVSSPRT